MAPEADPFAKFEAEEEDPFAKHEVEPPKAEKNWGDKAKGALKWAGETATDSLKAAEQGVTFKFADELGAAGQMQLDALSKMVPKGALDWAGIENRYGPGFSESVANGGMMDTYRQARDGNRAEYKAAEKRSPKAFGRAEFLSGFLVPGGAAKSLGAAAKVGGAMGALGGAGGSEADLTKGEIGRFLLDTGAGGVGGAAAGPLGYGIGKAAPVVLRATGDALRKAGTAIGRHVLERGARKARHEPLSQQAVEEALNSGAIVPFGTTGGAAERLERSADDWGNIYGAELRKMQELGAEGPPLMATKDALYRRADQVHRGITDRNVGAGDPKVRGVYQSKADDLVGMFGDRTGQKLRDLKTRRYVSPEAATLPLTIAENFKRTVGKRADFGRIEDTLENETLQDVYRIVKEASEQAVDRAGQKAGPGTELANLAESFKPTKQKLANLLAAKEAAAMGAAKASRASPGPGIKDLTTGAMLSPDGGTALALAMLSRFAKERLPSTAATALRGAGKIPAELGKAAARRPLQVVEGARRALGSEQRKEFPELSDAFWEQFAPAPPPNETDAERKLRLLRETLYPYGHPKPEGNGDR